MDETVFKEGAKAKKDYLPAIDASYDPTILSEDPDEPCWTPLQLASRKGAVAEVEAIIDQDPQAVNATPQGYYGQTAIQTACIQGHKEVVEVLIKAGADIHFCGGNNMQRTALEFACGQGDERIVDLLLENGGRVNMTHSIPRVDNTIITVTRYNGRTPLQAAAERGHATIVAKLLRLGAHVNAPPSPSHGRSAIQAAAENGFADVVETLIKHESDVNALGAKYLGVTALQAASLGGHLEVMRLLLGAGADVHAQGGSKSEGTALHAAAERGQVNAIRMLVDHGANVNCVSARRGITPIQVAHRKGQEMAVQVLRELGA